MPTRGEPLVVHLIITNLMEGKHEKGHVLVTNNYFTSVDLFEELTSYGTYTTSIM